MAGCFLALDAGTTSCRTLVFSGEGKLLGLSQKEFTQHFPQPGWVEHDAEEIWEAQLFTFQDALSVAGLKASDVKALGITNQRETVVAWDAQSHKPLHRAIVWQDRRTADLCNALRREGLEPYIRQNTGLVADAYFSATKMHWLLQNVPAVAEAALNGTLRFGTIDCWLLWKLTQGRIYATDASNASRTLLFNILKLEWDEVLLRRFGIHISWLPEVRPSIGFLGFVNEDLLGHSIPIAAMAGDQQAALYGHRAWQPGAVKNTFGTGCFMLMNIGSEPVMSRFGMLTTIAWQKNHHVTYALEGSVFVAGAAIQWLRDGLGILEKASDSEAMALSVPDNGGVYLVPAFTGLGAPYWDMDARGLITGLTRGTTKAHLVRAALEAMAYQTYEILECMQKDASCALESLSVDGGATANTFLLEFLAGLLGKPVRRPAMQEMTAFGVARMAAEAMDSPIQEKTKTEETLILPKMTSETARSLLEGWRMAVTRTLSGAKK
jgi:glycerol kinase